MNFKLKMVTVSKEVIEAVTPWIEVKVHEVVWFDDESKTMFFGKMEEIIKIEISRENN